MDDADMAEMTNRKPALSIQNVTLFLALAPLAMLFAVPATFQFLEGLLGWALSPLLMLGPIGAYMLVLLLARCPVCRGLPMSSDGTLAGTRRLNPRPATCGKCSADFRRLTFWSRVPRDDLLTHMAFRRENGLGTHDFTE